MPPAYDFALEEKVTSLSFMILEGTDAPMLEGRFSSVYQSLHIHQVIKEFEAAQAAAAADKRLEA